MREAKRNGVVVLDFSVEMKIPPFARSKRRQLLSLDTIDLERDVFGITYVVNSETDLSEISYYIEITEWTDKKMELAINFTNPLVVSKGIKKDLMMLTIKNPLLFISAKTMIPIPASNRQVVIEIPKQFPKGVDAETITSSAENTTKSLMVIMIIQLIL